MIRTTTAATLLAGVAATVLATAAPAAAAPAAPIPTFNYGTKSGRSCSPQNRSARSPMHLR